MSLKAISEYIFKEIEGKGYSKLTLRHIYLILFLRNSYLEYKNDKLSECPFNESLFDYVANICERDSININNETLEKILEMANDIDTKDEYAYLRNIKDSFLAYPIIPDIYKEYKFNKWTEWEKRIDRAIEDFYNEFALTPKYLYANEHTFSQIDFVVNLQTEFKCENFYHVNEKTGERTHVSKNDEEEICSYTSDEFEIMFCINNDLNDKRFVLGFDEDDDDEDDDDNENDVIDPEPVGKRELVKI
jgi:hypothetical protein